MQHVRFGLIIRSSSLHIQAPNVTLHHNLYKLKLRKRAALKQKRMQDIYGAVFGSKSIWLV